MAIKINRGFLTMGEASSPQSEPSTRELFAFKAGAFMGCQPDRAYLLLRHAFCKNALDGEKNFAEALQGAEKVLIFAKLPRKLKIQTPVGNYAPDWAIVFENDSVRHVFFIAETKGSLDNMELRGMEKAKTECAKQLFNSISTNHTRFGVVDKFENLYNIINGIE